MLSVFSLLKTGTATN